MQVTRVGGRNALSVAIAAALVGSLGTVARAADTGGLEEVVVTASKREERLINVPVAITAVDSGTIENLGIKGFDDYLGLVPGVSQRSAGAPGFGTVIIRGLNSGPQQTTSTTGFYIDDVPFTASGSLSIASFVNPDVDLADVERVEVLKGPQGTLYGASSLGGLIRIISKRPSLTDFEGSLGVSGTSVDGGGTGYGANAGVSIPLIQDTMGLRVSGFYRDEPGYTTNVGTGHDEVNDTKISGGRLSWLTKFSDDVDLLVTGLYQKIDADSTAGEDTVTDTLKPLYGQYKFKSYFDPYMTLEMKSAGATLNWKLGPGTLTGTAAYNNYDMYTQGDYTDIYGSTVAFLYSLIAPGAPYPENAGLRGDPAPASTKKTAEIRYASDRIGRFEFLGGLFYTDEDNSYPIHVHGEFQDTQEPLPFPLDNVLTSVTDSTYKEKAVFGNATFYFTDDLDLTLGARYAKNEQDVDTSHSGLLYFIFGEPEKAHFSLNDDATTYLAALRWRQTEDLSWFLRAASGYRPGGPQTNPGGDPIPYKPDTVWNYEAGFKSVLADKRLFMTGSVFYIDWKDIQLNTLQDGFLLIGNGGAARADGVEFDMQFRATDALNLGFNFGYTDTEITQIDELEAEQLGAVKGDSVPLTADWTGSATADWHYPLSNNLQLALGATVKYQGDRPSSFSASELNPNIDIPSYTTLDLRAGLDWGHYRVQLLGNNLTNEHGITGALTNKIFPGQPVPTNLTVIQPLTVMLKFSADF
jgi:outer membrane receptor protein involved in Fe transport